MRVPRPLSVLLVSPANSSRFSVLCSRNFGLKKETKFKSPLTLGSVLRKPFIRHTLHGFEFEVCAATGPPDSGWAANTKHKRLTQSNEEAMVAP